MHTLSISNFLIALFLLLFTAGSLQAHNLWIETDTKAEVGQVHKAYIYLGEYAYGVRDDVSENREMLGKLSIILIKPNGETQELSTAIESKRFVAEFTPEQEGHYQLALNVTNAPVVDWTEYDMGILKTNFFSSAVVSVGASGDGNLSSDPLAKANQLSVQPTEAGSFDRQTPTRFTVTYKGEPLAKHEVKIGYQDQWFKTLYTDEQGQITVSFPWDKQFVIETIHTEIAPGVFEGDDYEAIRHTATFSIPPANQ